MRRTILQQEGNYNMLIHDTDKAIYELFLTKNKKPVDLTRFRVELLIGDINPIRLNVTNGIKIDPKAGHLSITFKTQLLESFAVREVPYTLKMYDHSGDSYTLVSGLIILT